MKETNLECLSKVSGISKGIMREIWDAVVKNKEKLKACSKLSKHHEFVEIKDPKESEGAKKLRRRYKCKHCSGVVDPINKLWYERGLEDGKDAEN